MSADPNDVETLPEQPSAMYRTIGVAEPTCRHRRILVVVSEVRTGTWRRAERSSRHSVGWRKRMTTPHDALTTWSEEWPNEPNTWWWLYARFWGFENQPKLRPVMVMRMADGINYLMDGTLGELLGADDLAEDIEGKALWTPMTMPRLPDSNAVHLMR